MLLRKSSPSHAVILFTVDNQKDDTDDHQHRGQRLRNADIVAEHLKRQIQTVGAQSFDQGALQTVPYQIQIEHLSVVFLEFAVEDEQEQKSQRTPNRFI